jgi:outer membrane receptor protein involved in Fe transport
MGGHLKNERGPGVLAKIQTQHPGERHWNLPVPAQAASVTVVSQAQLRAQGATDLRGALAMVAGVDVAPGGDGGPAASVPELQGLREADAFLLLVDGVPWGGAFNPDLPSIDLNDIDHVEVLHGAAPVKYGATAFVGVINLIHRPPGSPGRASAYLGSRGSVEASVALPLGLRLNHSRETRDARLEPSDPSQAVEVASDKRSDDRPSGLAALSYRLWQAGRDHTLLYGSYRNTYKPAAADFGPEAESAILTPETARSYELGIKGRVGNGRFSWDASTFLVNFDNVVIPGSAVPALQNGGKQRLEGAEL